MVYIGVLPPITQKKRYIYILDQYKYTPKVHQVPPGYDLTTCVGLGIYLEET
jgi:hypothetical protein